MNSAAEVTKLVDSWKESGLSKAEIVVRTAEAELGWCYVWGATGQECTPAKREAAIRRCSAAEAEIATKKCQVLSGKKSACSGCAYYPDGQTTLMDDCQGFVKQICRRVGVTFTGGGCTSMWNDAKNWTEQGAIKDMPDVVCCVFMKNGSKMSHIGLHVGGGRIIHCSGNVKEGKTTDRGWTNYAIPKGLEGGTPVAYPTLRKGSTGEYVTLAQTKLIQLGYDVGKTGADGKYGDKTAAAVKQFQKDRDLKADGVVGPVTWDALLNGETVLYTVMIQHVGKAAAEEIVTKYGGTMTKEGE